MSLRNLPRSTMRDVLADTFEEIAETEEDKKIVTTYKEKAAKADALEKDIEAIESIVETVDASKADALKRQIQTMRAQVANIDRELNELEQLIGKKPIQEKTKKSKRSSKLFKNLCSQIHNALYAKRKIISILFFVVLSVYFVANSIADGFMWGNSSYSTNQYRYLIDSIRLALREIGYLSETVLIIIGLWFFYNIITSVVLAIKKAKEECNG